MSTSPSGSSIGPVGGRGAAEGVSRAPPPQVTAPFFSLARPPEQTEDTEAAAPQLNRDRGGRGLEGAERPDTYSQVNTPFSLPRPPETGEIMATAPGSRMKQGGSANTAASWGSHRAQLVPFFSFPRPPELAESTTVLAIILSTLETGPLILVNSRGMVGHARRGAKTANQGAARESAVTVARRWAALVLPEDRPQTFLAAQITGSPEGVLLVIVAPCMHLAGREVLDRLGAGIVASRESFGVFWGQGVQGWAACTWNALRDTVLAPACGAALMAVDRLVHRPRSTSEPLPFKIAADVEGDGVAAERWKLMCQLHEAVQNKVRRALLAAGGEVAEYVDRVGGSALAQAPMAVRGRDLDAQDPEWALERFSAVLLPPKTDPMPPATPQPPLAWRPSDVRELLEPGAWERLDAWRRLNVLDIEDMGRGNGHAARPHKPRPFVLAQSDFVPLARGRVWDLRRSVEGIIEPLDFTVRPAMGLNVALLTTLLAKCPDRELVESHLVYGVDFKADLPLHAVFLPHMASLATNVGLVQTEIERLTGNGRPTISAHASQPERSRRAQARATEAAAG